MIKTAILVYLIIGTLFMFCIETFWDRLELEDPEAGLVLDWYLRFSIIFFWPIPLTTAIIGILIGTEENDDSNKDDGNNDTIGPGFGT